MGDAIDDMRALGVIRTEQRTAGWEGRETWMQALRQIGLEPRVVSEEARHCRVALPGDGWFDFWPSSGKWSQSRRKGNVNGARGVGLPEFLAAVALARGGAS